MTPRLLLPALGYLTVAVGIPLLNGGYARKACLLHCLWVTVLVGVAVLAIATLGRLRRLFGSRRRHARATAVRQSTT